MRRFALTLLAFVAPTCAYAQGSFTNVTGIVQDPLSNIYQNGTYSVNFVDPGTSGKLPLLPGNQVFQTSYSGSLDSFGFFTVSLPDNGVIASASGATGTSWQFFICANPGILRLTTANPIPCFSYTAPIICATNSPTTCSSSTITITAQLKAVAAYLPIPSNRYFPVITSSSALPALTGFLQLESGDSICWRNNSNNADLCFSKSITDAFSLPNLTVSNLTPGRCVEAGTGGVLTTIGTSCSGAGISSVGLALPKEFSISGSPVTSSGTLTGAWIPPTRRTFLAGPGSNTVAGVLDTESTATSSSTSLVNSTTPTTTKTIVFLGTTIHHGLQSSPPVPPATWISIGSTGEQEVLYKILSTSAPISATTTFANADTSLGIMFGLKYPSGTPTIRQFSESSGSSPFTAPLGMNTLAGSTLVAIICGQFPNTPGAFGFFYDDQGDAYSTIGYSTNGDQYCIAGMSAGITGVTTPTILFLPTPSFVGGVYPSSKMIFFEVTGLATQSADPGFRTIQVFDLPAPFNSPNLPTVVGANKFFASGLSLPGTPDFRLINGLDLPATTGNCTGQNFAQGLSAGGTPICVAATTGLTNQVFSATTLGADVSVSATTQTDIMTRTIVMPSSGCPCRVFMSYSLYITTGSSGVGYSAWVNDGTNDMGGTNAGQSNGSSGALTSLSYSGYTTVTYSNNATVVFTLRTEGDHTYTVRKLSQVAGSAPNSSFQVAAQESN